MVERWIGGEPAHIGQSVRWKVQGAASHHLPESRDYVVRELDATRGRSSGRWYGAHTTKRASQGGHACEPGRQGVPRTGLASSPSDSAELTQVGLGQPDGEKPP